MYLILILIFVLETYEINIKIQNTEEKNVTLKFQIIQQYFKNRECIAYIELTTIETDINIFYKNINIPKKILKIYKSDIDIENEPKYRPRRDFISPDGIINKFCQERNEGTIIFSPNFELIQKYTYNARVSPFLSPQTKFVIYLTEDSKEMMYEEYYKKLWKIFRTPHVIILEESIFFYNQFIPGLNWGKLYKYTLEEIKKSPFLIENKMMYFNRYPFRTILFNSLMAYLRKGNGTFADYGGMDAELYGVMETYMNITKVELPKIPDADYGQVYSNGSVKGSLRNLIEGDVELVCVSYFLKDYLSRDIEFSAVGMQDDLCVMVSLIFNEMI